MIRSIFLILFLFSSTLKAQDSFNIIDETGRTMSLLEFQESMQVPGMSMIVLRDLKIDTMITQGFADPQQEIPVTANTRFQVGGMSSALLQFMVLRTATLGKIDLDQPANQYLSSWKIPDRRFTRRAPVTVRDLLLHRRGFNLGSKPAGLEPEAPLYNMGQALTGQVPAHNPAVKLERNENKTGNASYANQLILQQLMEEVWGEPLEVVVRREILEPLDMRDSWFGAGLPTENLDLYAVGHDEKGEEITGRRHGYAESGAAGLWTTPHDYAKFVAHVFEAARGAENNLISQPLAEQSISPQYKFRSLIFHQGTDLYWGGASDGFYTAFSGKPESGTIVIVFTNAHLSWRFTNQVAGMGWDFSRRKK